MNNKSQIKIAFFDIDETLYDKDNAYLPPSIIEQVLPRLRQKGILTAIATGRCFGAFPKALQPLLDKNCFDIFVTINGQCNFQHQHIISEYPFPTERIAQVVHTLDTLGIVYAFVSSEQIALSAYSELSHQAISPIKPDYIIDPDFYQKNKIFQILAFYPTEWDQKVVDTGILGDDLKIMRWHNFGIDILHKDHSKAKGIRDVLNRYHLKPENAIAFGDGFNDIEMFESVGIAVAMGNAVLEAKNAADFITKTASEDGILYALETLNII